MLALYSSLSLPPSLSLSPKVIFSKNITITRVLRQIVKTYLSICIIFSQKNIYNQLAQGSWQKMILIILFINFEKKHYEFLAIVK